jgi:two-component system, LytTR family, response regulator
MNQIKLLLADDNQESLEILEHFIENIQGGFQVVGKCNDGEQLIDLVMQLKPDLVITDINMPKKNGIEAMKECLSFYPTLRVIFITGYEEYAVEAFRLHAIDYVIKPYEKTRLYQALEKAREIITYTPKEKRYEKIKNLPIKQKNSTYFVPLDEIFFIEKSEKKCLVYTKKQVFETSESISKILEKSDNHFFLAHRSYIINLQKVSHIVPQKESYISYFYDFDMNASVSKLKINEMRDRLAAFLQE